MRWWSGMHALWKAPVDNIWAPETNLPPPEPKHVCVAAAARQEKPDAAPTRAPASLNYERRQAG